MSKYNPKKKHYFCDNCYKKFEGFSYYAGIKDREYCKACAYKIAKLRKDVKENLINSQVADFNKFSLVEIRNKLSKGDILKEETNESRTQLINWLIELIALREIINNIKFEAGKYNR